MDSHQFHSFDKPQGRWSALELDTSPTSILLATVVGAYLFLKALELAGFPIWLRLQQVANIINHIMWSRGASAPLSDTETRQDTAHSGGMLSSIFGLKSDGLLGKGVRGLTEALSSGPSNVPPGLGNISNSCYQNSVIQGLAALPSLRDYLSKLTAENASFTTETTNGALHELLGKLNNPEYQGQSFWIRGKLKSMSTFTQQDAQEYYSKILDEMDKEVKKAASTKRRASVSWVEATKSLDESPAEKDDENEKEKEQQNTAHKQTPLSNMTPNPLDGLIAQRVGCTTCGYSEGLSLITFNCITVSLGNRYGYDIRECLDEYTKLEYIDGVECAKCTLLKLQTTLAPLAAAKPGSPFETKLNAVSEMIDDEKFEDNTLVKTLNIPKKNWVQSSKSKQIVIARAPKSLILHVNRSIFDEMTGAQYKNSANVEYPRILDLGHWCLGNLPNGPGQSDLPPEEWPRDPTRSMLQDNDLTALSPFQYRLRAAVTHFGSHGNGHYVCYRPYAGATTRATQEQDNSREETTNEQWWRFSDDNVYAVPENQAHQGSVFMLFYERLDDPVPSPEIEPELVADVIPVAENAPLPPQNIQERTLQVDDETAAAIPLPQDDDDDLSDLTPPELPVPHHTTPEIPLRSVDQPDTAAHTYPTPPPDDIQDSPATPTSHDSENKTVSEVDESEDDSSTQCTSESEAEIPSPPTPKPIMRVPPHLMRSAGGKVGRGQGERQSLALVSAT